MITDPMLVMNPGKALEYASIIRKRNPTQTEILQVLYSIQLNKLPLSIENVLLITDI
jgi:hypothetical protein